MKKYLLLTAVTLGMVAYANSPYIYRIHDYRPAPGQFINVLPEYENGDTQASMNAKCEEYLAGQQRGSMVSLGAYGGYIVFSFDHPVQNSGGEYDFKIYGNAIAESGHSDAGSSEPGIVMVSMDSNANGIPDDEWYELAGSDYYKSSTLHDYSITYYRPVETAPDATYIRWTSSDTSEPEGYVQRNKFHRQSYWPQWMTADELKFSGARLARNAFNEGSMTLLRFLDWGYADNLPNAREKGFRLDWAVDRQGNPVKLTHIDFVKVYTGINQYCGDMGETSTEILGAEDLHPDHASVAAATSDNVIHLLGCSNGHLLIDNGGETCTANVYDIQGRAIGTISIESGYGTYDVSGLAPGVYILRCHILSARFMR